MKVALTIAGSDPTGAAGLELDLRVFQAHGVHGCGVATALTVQDTRGVHEVNALSASAVRRRLDVLTQDVRPDVVKLGMLSSKEMVDMVIETMTGTLEGIPLVIDPVIVSSSGTRLLDLDALPVFRESLIPLATMITPNLREAQVLLQSAPKTRTSGQMALELSTWGPSVVITGGDLDEPKAVDVVCTNGELQYLESHRVVGDSPHGTGCTFSAAVTANLVNGMENENAVRLAKTFTMDAIAKARRFGGNDGRPFCQF